LCERLNLEEGVTACRAALALGIGPARRGAVRQMLARHLVALEKWGELAGHFREDVALDPEDAVAWQRLGTTLLFALDEHAQAITALEEARRLAPGDAETRVALDWLWRRMDGSRRPSQSCERRCASIRPRSTVVRPRAPCSTRQTAASPGLDGDGDVMSKPGRPLRPCWRSSTRPTTGAPGTDRTCVARSAD